MTASTQGLGSNLQSALGLAFQANSPRTGPTSCTSDASSITKRDANVFCPTGSQGCMIMQYS